MISKRLAGTTYSESVAIARANKEKGKGAGNPLAWGDSGAAASPNKARARPGQNDEMKGVFDWGQ